MTNKNENSAGVLEPEQHSKAKPQHIDVAVITTSGTWPESGFDNVPIHQPIKVQLHCSVKELKITDTTNWIAKVGNQELNIEQSYEQNSLSGQVEIDYGPREGGGGNE
jgi:hypothetical protein